MLYEYFFCTLIIGGWAEHAFKHSWIHGLERVKSTVYVQQHSHNSCSFLSSGSELLVVGLSVGMIFPFSQGHLHFFFSHRKWHLYKGGGGGKEGGGGRGGEEGGGAGREEGAGRGGGQNK